MGWFRRSSSMSGLGSGSSSATSSQGIILPVPASSARGSRVLLSRFMLDNLSRVYQLAGQLSKHSSVGYRDFRSKCLHGGHFSTRSLFFVSKCCFGVSKILDSGDNLKYVPVEKYFALKLVCLFGSMACWLVKVQDGWFCV